MQSSNRDYNQEFQENSRKYSYDFDDILRGYMIDTFRPFLQEGKSLEMGCFEGVFTALMEDSLKLKDITVIEASSDLINTAKKRMGERVKYINSTFESANLEPVYDNIFLIHTLEHLDDPIFVLKKVNSWLSDKGRFIVCVPNANAPSRQIAVKMGLIPTNQSVTPAEHEHGHRKTYVFDTLEYELKQANLKIEARGGIFFKSFANFQFDKLIADKIVGKEFLDGCYQLGFQYPDLCASIYFICSKN